jgi:hypothetical protein
MKTRLAAIAIFLFLSINSFAAERWRDSLPQGKIYHGFILYYLELAELKLTDAQSKVLEKTFKAHLAQSRKATDQLAREGVGTKGEDGQRRYSVDRRLQVESADAMFDALDEQQQKRAVELSLQYAGNFAFREKRLAEELALSEEQRDKIDAVFDDFSTRENASAKEFQNDRKRKDEDYQRLRKEQRKEILAVLTEEQLAKYKSLLGKPSLGTWGVCLKRGGNSLGKNLRT